MADNNNELVSEAESRTEESDFTEEDTEEEVEEVEAPRRTRHRSGYQLFLQVNSVCCFDNYFLFARIIYAFRRGEIEPQSLPLVMLST